MYRYYLCLMLINESLLSEEKVVSFGGRHLVISWYFIVLVLTQSYTASLTSLLTTQQLNPTVTSIRSLLEKGERVGYQRTSFIHGKLIQEGFSPSKLVPFDTSEECNALLRNRTKKGGISGAFQEIPYLRLFLGQYCNKYKMVEEPFNVDGFGFVFPIGSPLVADVSRAILKVAESPEATKLERAWFKKKEKSCPDPDTSPDPNPSVTSRQLGLDSFRYLFIVVLGLCIVTLGIFTFHFLFTSKWGNLWGEFKNLETKSYIFPVEEEECSSEQQPPDDTNSQAAEQDENR